MKKLLAILFLLSSLQCFSQKQDRNWCFGLRVGIDFNDTINPIPFTSAITSNSLTSYSSMSDVSGLSKGLYFVTITDGMGNKFVIKVMKM